MCLIFLDSSVALVCSEVGNILFTLSGHHVLTSLPSFENKNLLHADPQNMTIGSPKSEVLKTLEEYWVMRSKMKLSGFPFQPDDRKAKLSPITGYPILPGGRLGLIMRQACLKKRMKRERVERKRSMRKR